MLDWMQELLELPDKYRSTTATGGGVIQGSASEATLSSTLAAGWRTTQGKVNLNGDTLKQIAHCTSQSHSSIEKGLRIAGIGTQNIRFIEHDDIRHERQLEAQIIADKNAELIPFWICSTHGTTSSGAFDLTPAIGLIAKRHQLWLHVDAAMHGITALAPELRWLNDGLQLTDSYCTNPHMWMGVNFDCDLFWTSDHASFLVHSVFCPNTSARPPLSLVQQLITATDQFR